MKARILMAALALFGMFMAVVVLASGEITINQYLNVDNAQYKQVKNVNQLKADQVRQFMSAGIQSINTGAWEQVVLAASVTTNGWAFFKNVTTNTDRYIDVGTAFQGTNYVAFVRLLAGESALLPLAPTSTLFAAAFDNAYTGAIPEGVSLEFWVNNR